MAVMFNGRTAVHQASNGTLVTEDICLTGSDRTPITYTNVAKSSDATNTATTVFSNNNPLCHKKSCFAKSSGDEAGNHKGIKSGTIQGKAEFLTASKDIFIEGIPAVRQSDLMVANNRNSTPEQLLQP